MSPTAARTATAERRAPRRVERPEERRTPLSVVDKRAGIQRARRRRERLLFVVSGAIVAAALTVVATAQGVVTSQQEHLDTVNQKIATAVVTEQRLQIARAKLAAPSRILEIAEKKLHMVAPTSVTYLTPVSSVASRHTAHGSAAR